MENNIIKYSLNIFFYYFYYFCNYSNFILNSSAITIIIINKSI